MSGMFSVPKAPRTIPPPQATDKSVDDAAAAEAELARRRKKKGLQVTGPAGVESTPSTLTTKLGE